ncbi:hypothetical protein C8R45DRAFT_957651 [Mycena sanguinolenta]|nr:hypothetical protein C8R45DRAFT_957651 [Mycena sanguinolenta]
MRRIASVFGRKDKDRPAVRLAPTPPPVPSLTSEPASSSSSNGSALHTPADDYDPVPTSNPTRSKSWTAWLGKKSGTIKRRRPGDQHTPLDQGWVEPEPEWRPKQPAPILHAPPIPKSVPHPRVDIHVDSDEDVSSLGSDNDEVVPHSAPALQPPTTPTSVAQSRKNLEILIQNSLIPPLAPSTPFSQLAGCPMYPRSSNPPHSLPVRPTMQTAMHRSILLRRLQQPDVSTLSVAQQLDRSILPLASRPSPTPVDPPAPLPWFNDRALPAAMKLSPSSPGLRRWMSRPCFEERIAVWVPLDGVVTCQSVTGSSCAVAELEYSAALDTMIGFGLPLVEEEASPPVMAAAVPTPQQPQPAAAAVVRNITYQAVPSPLRNSTLKSKSPVSQTHPSSPTTADSPAQPTPPAAPAPPASRVRFVEDDKDDVIPLGYTLRLKKRREEKAKFLREEQEKRAHEAEKAKHEAERQRRELERKQWEEEKRAWEKEQRAMEEERKRRVYADEVAATRLRREHQRAGGGYGTSETNLLAPSSSTTSLRDERNKQDTGTYSRPLHDQLGPRRQASEPIQLATPSSSPHTSSPDSSRPPSVAGHHAGSLRGSSSRPPSVHTSSSEDARQQHTSTKAGKRGSMASLPAKMPSNQLDPYSTWFASNPTLMVPPVPPVPMFAMDTPLLPPTPPFMLQQYPRPRSQSSQHSVSPGRSSPSSGSPSRQRLPSSGSSERVNVVQHQQQSRSSSSSRRPSNASASSLVRPTASHQRRSSDDVRRTSLPPPKDSQPARGRPQPSSVRSQSNSSLARGRPPMPSAYQPPVPSPWSAPPLATSYSQQQLSPAAIINGYQAVQPKATRRQTTIS